MTIRQPKNLPRRLTLLCAPALVFGVTACGTATVSTSAFKGEQRAVAETISNLQSNATAGEEKKICANDLSRAVVARLAGTKGCEAAIKNQLAEVDSLAVSVKAIQIAGTTASVRVKSIAGGKSKLDTLTLVKEGKAWKISKLG
jgi:Zn-dependent alcohol dehydrogenase